ncbi:MEDS domain-containing protein [Nonomuraea rubra]|uniref:MEDS domain-containing protein n=1 Tax=Nonomuraea rubra TaxID=46180 RepID=UPI0036181B74
MRRHPLHRRPPRPRAGVRRAGRRLRPGPQARPARRVRAGRRLLGACDAPRQAAFEAKTNELFGERWLAAVCQYDRGLFPREAIDRATSVHPIAPEQALLRFANTFEPAGLRVWGTST